MDPQRWLDAVDEPVLAINEDGRIAALNVAAADLTGYRVEDLRGQSCEVVFSEPVCGPLGSEATPIERWNTQVSRKDGVQLEVMVSRARLDVGGDASWVLFTIHSETAPSTPMDPARAAAWQRTVLDSLEEGVVTIDETWRVTSMNSAATRILGTPEHSALGMMCSHVLRSEACRANCPLARALEQRNSVRNERVLLTRADGRPVRVSINCSVIRRDDGDPRGGVLSFRETNDPHPVRQAFKGDGFHGLIGRSSAMRQVFRFIEDIADSPSTVLITGESGTGKELIANAIQEESTRRNAPYVKVNCSVFSEGLLESELFGHVKGSFTDARRDHRGRFELADGGTLFLDEIGEISSRLQVKLLRVLQERSFERVGGESTISVDIRLITATNRDLDAMVKEELFREDLFYRLNVIPIRVPPLRERREDIPFLVDHFVRKFAHATKKPIRYVDEEAMSCFIDHTWPGNVRQLENALEYAFARARGDTLTCDLFPPDILQSKSSATASISSDGKAANEAQRITQALDKHHWHHANAAAELGISRTTLWRKMRKLGLDVRTSEAK